jgi:hypothetical protein
VEAVDDRSLDVDPFAVQPRGHQPAYRRRREERRVVLTGAQHPLPAVALRGHRQRDDRPLGVPDEVRVRHAGQRRIDARVDDEPALGERRAAERDPQPGTNRGAASVAGHEPARAQRGARRAGGAAERHRDAVRPLLEAFHPLPPARRDRREPAQAVEQHALHRRLVDRHERRVAERPVAARTTSTARASAVT